MRRIVVDVADFDGTIEIGKQGEDIATDVVFDCGKWLEEIAEQSGVLSLAFQRPKDTIAAEVVTVDVTETTLVWHVNEIHLENNGIGYAEIRYTSGGKFKSRTFLVFVQRGLSTAFAPNNYEPIPEPPTEYGSYNLMYYVGAYDAGYQFAPRKLELKVDTGNEPVQPQTVYDVTGATYEEFYNAILAGIPISLEFLFVDYEMYVAEMTAYRKSDPVDAFSSGLTFLDGNFVNYFIHIYRDSEDETKLSAQLYLP